MSDKPHTIPAEENWTEVSMNLLSDLGAPQDVYRRLIEAGGFIQPMEGMAISYDRRLTEFVLREPRFSSRVEMMLGNVRPLIPLNVDPPEHSKYRKLLDPLFAPRRMDEYESEIVERANRYIDNFIERGQCNFTDEFADLFPSSVFLALTGLPEDQLEMFLRLRDGILHPEKIEPGAAFEVDKRQAVVAAAGKEVYQYFDALVEERSIRPTDDIVSRFLEAEVGGERMVREEILDILYLFLIAGLDTVSDSLTCFFAFLAQHPDHRRQITDNPNLIPAAVEELLRWESPVPTGSPRVATSDISLPDGTVVSAGTAVLVCYGAGNVDPKGVDDAFSVIFDRNPNGHMAFGAGVHRCLGSHLARRELRVTLREWHRRIPEYWISPGHEQLAYQPGLRHVKDLMLSWV